MSKQMQPNIVFVLCDNTGLGDFWCYTSTFRIDKGQRRAHSAQGLKSWIVPLCAKLLPTLPAAGLSAAK